MAHFALLLALLCCPVAALAQPAGDPVVIGGLFDLSGPAAVSGHAGKRVAEMAVHQINAMGGLLGHPVKFVCHDTASSPEQALRQARRLVEEDKVLAVVGPGSIGEGLAVKQYTEAKHVPAIMLATGDAIIAGGKFGPCYWTFKTPQRTAAAVAKIYDYLKGKNIANIAVLRAKDDFGQDGLTELRDKASTHGITIVAEEAIEPGTAAHLSAAAAKIQAAKPQAVVVWATGAAGAEAAKHFAALPGDRPLLVQCLTQAGPAYVKLAGEASGGTIMPATWLMAPESLPDEDPQKLVIETFIKQYTESHLQDAAPLDTCAGYVYDAFVLLRAALEKSGKAEPEALRDALQSLHHTVGVSGVYNLSPEDHNGLGPDSLIMLIVDSGRFKLAP